MDLIVKNLNFSYRNSKNEILKDFSVEVEPCSILCILGESGSGKSTVLRLLAGLEVPKNGEIEIKGKKIVGEGVWIEPEKRGVGMVFQDYALFPHMTVEKNIMYGLKGKNREEKLNIVQEMLELVNMEEYRDNYPYELSGGQQQRVALARALAPKPSILLLDEPFSNLDANLQQKIRNELKEILTRAKMTSIFVTHDIEDARALADTVIILEKGKTIKSGRAEQILSK